MGGISYMKNIAKIRILKRMTELTSYIKTDHMMGIDSIMRPVFTCIVA